MKESQSENEFASVWNRAKELYLSTLLKPEDKSKAERYLSATTGVAKDDSNVTVFVSNEYATELLNAEYQDPLQNCLILLGIPKTVSLVFKLDEKAQSELHARKAPKSLTAVQKATVTKATPFVSTVPLNPNYSFDEFVVGPSNSWAHAAAQGIVADPGNQESNPLFIHGGTGLGKTHLMQAIGNALVEKNPSMSVCYLTAEILMNEYVNALTNKTMEQYRERYRKIDILLIDDIQFIAQMRQFQEEFFNTFNALTSLQKQIVMTSDVAPKDLPNIETRLISRFQGGMVQEIELPSYETRLAILKKKAESCHPTVPVETLDFIAKNIKSHVRAMEGALGKIKIILRTNPTMTLTEDILTYHLRDFIEKEKNLKKLTIEEIQTTVARKYGVTVANILSSDRTQTLVTPRQVAMFIARKYTNKSLPEIARLFDKSHATILHGVKNIAKRIDVERELKGELVEILDQFGYTLEDQIV